MALRLEPTLANHCAHCAPFAHCKIDGNMIRVLTYTLALVAVLFRRSSISHGVRIAASVLLEKVTKLPTELLCKLLVLFVNIDVLELLK
eukprot:COSAG02_NODE_124_length_35047_cov_31.554179_33_plen_89_part_00